MASRRPISCIRQWKHLEEIRFPFKASVRTSLPCPVFYRPLCRGVCHRGPAPAATPTLSGGRDECFSMFWIPHPLPCFLALSSAGPHQPATFCHFFYEISGYIGFFFKPLPLLPIFQSPPHPTPPTKVLTQSPRVWKYRAAVKDTGEEYELWSLMTWVQILYSSSYQLCNPGQISLLSPSPVKWGQEYYLYDKIVVGIKVFRDVYGTW